MDFGITLKPDLDPDRLIALTRQAEAAGFGYGWIFDSHVLWLEPYPLLGIAAVFMVGQLLEGMLLTPLLVGDRIGLHPVAVIFAILAGGQLFGFTGVLLALPVAAVIMVLLRHAHDLYKLSGLYGESNSGSDEPPSPA